MIYRIKEKFWSWGDDFAISDKQGNPKFKVKGQVFSWGDNLSFQNTQGEELAAIVQKLMSWKPRYEIQVGGQRFAEVVQEFSWFNKKFTLDIPGPNDYTIEGSFWKHEYTFVRNGRQVAKINKDFWGWHDSYGVQIEDGENDVAILCSCIVIDQVLHDQASNYG